MNSLTCSYVYSFGSVLAIPSARCVQKAKTAAATERKKCINAINGKQAKYVHKRRLRSVYSLGEQPRLHIIIHCETVKQNLHTGNFIH